MRTRRNPDQAKTYILDVAEARFQRYGREGLTLKDIAKDAGITHSNILHHFGSRDGLHQALVARLISRLVEDIITRLAEDAPTPEGAPSPILALLYDTLVKGGHAKLLVWQLAESKGPEIDGLSDTLSPIFEALKDRLVAHAERQNRPISSEEAAHFIQLAATAAVGDAVIGPTIRTALNTGGDVQSDYLKWFTDLLLKG